MGLQVLTLSRLHHKYIVRYYQAWVEGGTSGLPGSSDEDDSFSDEETSTEMSESTGGLRRMRCELRQDEQTFVVDLINYHPKSHQSVDSGCVFSQLACALLLSGKACVASAEFC